MERYVGAEFWLAVFLGPRSKESMPVCRIGSYPSPTILEAIPGRTRKHVAILHGSLRQHAWRCHIERILHKYSGCSTWPPEMELLISILLPATMRPRMNVGRTRWPRATAGRQ